MNWGNVKELIKRELTKIQNNFYGVISSVSKNNNFVNVKISEDEELRDANIITPSGIYSIPKNDGMGQVIFNGSTKKLSFIGLDNSGKTPVKLDFGEVIIFSDDCYIHVKNGKIAIKGPVEVQGNLTVNGNISANNWHSH